MGGSRSSITSAVIAAASVLAYQTTSAHAAFQHQHLRHRNLGGTDDTREYEYLGCFKDSRKDRILGAKLTDDENVNADFCYDYCVALDAPFMATQWGIECWCSTEVEVDFERHGEGAECNFPCAADEKEMCGGFDAIDLYRIGSDGSEPKTTPDEALEDDIVKIVPVEGTDPLKSWADSYSVGDRCYIYSDFSDGIADYIVDTPLGSMTIRELYEEMGPGPGHDGHPLYNDIQCGNGPANNDLDLDEVQCPGLVEHGREGCGQIGPMWDLSELDDGDDDDDDTPNPSTPTPPIPTPPSPSPPSEPETTPEDALADDIVKIIQVVGANPLKSWADSYSVGDRCYMYSNFGHGIADEVVETPLGSMTIPELYDAMGPGPGHDGHPLYNDIQCGNGPANTRGDEVLCPGLVEYGRDGCGQIGPIWDLSELDDDSDDPEDAGDMPNPPTPTTPTPTPPTPTPPTPTPPSPSPPSEPETTPEDALADDIVKIIQVVGANPLKSWADSYSVGDRCYMYSNFDHGIADEVVETPLGSMTIPELYDAMGPGPGHDGHPLYNDIQCGNGPANTAGDEVLCPGLVEYGRDGCGQIGPMWDLSELERTTTPEDALEDDIVKIVPVEGANALKSWADSYSVGDRCYMYSNFDHNIADYIVQTPIGSMTIRELYDEMGPGPGHEGHALYNDIQCGNGPPNTAGDEVLCPGLVEYGRDGCGQIGPMWDLSELE